MKPAAWLNSDHKESPDESSIGCGRGGRAALLAAALQSRRPGYVSLEGSGPSPPAGSAEAGASNSPLSQSASSGSLEGATPTSSGGRGFAAGRAAPVEMVMKAAGVTAPGNRGMLTALGRSILHTPAGRQVLAQLKPPPVHQQPGQYSSPQPAQHMEPQQRPSAPQSRHAAGPAQGAIARHERSSQPPVGRMADLSIKQYRGKPSKPVLLEVNYVRLGTRRGMGVFEYHTDFEPVIDCKRTRFQLLATDPVVEAIGHTRMFDGSKLYLPHQLREKAISISTVLPSGGSAVMVHIQFVRQAPPSQCTHLYNVLFKKIMHCLQLTQIGHNYFDRKGAIMVPQQKLEVWPGYVQSVSEYDGGLLLNCDASFRVLRTMTAREVLFDVYNAYPREYKAKAAHAIVGSIVMTQYNYRTYRVDDIDWKQTPTCTFTFHTGEQITYKDYYKRIYNLDIQDWDQPLLVHRDKPRKGTLEAEGPRLVHLVPELCTLTGLTDTMRSDFRVMKDIAGHTRVNPSERQQSLLQYVRNVHNCEPAQRVLDDWGVTLDDAAIHVRAGWPCSARRKGDGEGKDSLPQWHSRLGPASLARLPLHACAPGERGGGLLQAGHHAHQGLQLGDVQGVPLHGHPGAAPPSCLSWSPTTAIKDVVSQRVQIVVIVFPSSRDGRYSAVKRLCCVDMPVPSQVITSNTIGQQHKLRSVTQRVALQINCKLGG